MLGRLGVGVGMCPSRRRGPPEQAGHGGGQCAVMVGVQPVPGALLLPCCVLLDETCALSGLP